MGREWSYDDIARRVLNDLPPNAYVNVGIGLPTTVLEASREDGAAVFFHSENGVLGIGPKSAASTEIPDLIDAGKSPASLMDGASFFSHVDSFAMIRSGRIDVSIMGAYQVSIAGDLANWRTNDPSEVPSVGGAMDLAYGARQVWVMCRHVNRDGSPRLVSQCTYPPTGRRCVTRVYTDRAVIDLHDGVATLLACAPGHDEESVQATTGFTLVTPS